MTNMDSTPSDDVTPSPSPGRRWLKRSGLGAAAFALAAASGAMPVAQATTPTTTTTTTTPSTTAPSGAHGHRGWDVRPAAMGTVASVGTNTFALKEFDGTTVTVDVSSSTTYRDFKVSSPTFANVTVGEMVVVEGTTASGVVTATAVDIAPAPPANAKGPGAPGTGAGAGKGGPGGPRGTWGPGQGKGPGPGGAPGGQGTRPAAVGKVASVGTNTFTLKEFDGTTVTVNVGSATTYKDGKDSSPSFANVTVGEMVVVEGTTSSGVVTATAVDIAPAPPANAKGPGAPGTGAGAGKGGPGGPRGNWGPGQGKGPGPGGAPGGLGARPAAVGTVASVGTGTFTLKEFDGTTVTVDVSSSTTYKDPKVTSPSSANVTVGEMVAVQGSTSSGVVTATSVAIFPAGSGMRHRR